jgi:hypothetical protein
MFITEYSHTGILFVWDVILLEWDYSLFITEYSNTGILFVWDVILLEWNH